jgi:hypothetical protein
MKGGISMGYAMEGGTPIVSSGMGGDGGIGSLLIGALLFGGGLGGFGGRGVAGADLAATAGIQNQLNGMQSQMTSATTNNEINQLQSDLNAMNIANLQGISNNALLYQGGNAQVLAAQAANNFTTLSSINGLGRDVTAAQNQGALQQLNSFNNLTTTTLQGFNEISRDSANAFNQVQMSLNAIAAQNAACCCELKSAIAHDGNETRALINSLNTQNLNTQIADLKSQVNTNAIINSLRPVVTV